MHLYKEETPLAATGGALSDGLEGLSLSPLSLDAQRAQFLIRSHSMRPAMAVAISDIVFAGGEQ